MKKSVIVGVVVVIILAVGGFLIFHKWDSKSSSTAGSNSDNMANMDMSSSSSTSTQATATNNVNIQSFSFQPASIVVKKGTKVTWTNNDSTAHTVTADNGSFDSGNLAQGNSFSHTFDTTGSFAYHCNIHSSMTAIVKVE